MCIHKIYLLCSGHKSGDALSSFSKLIRLSSTQIKSINKKYIKVKFIIILLKYMYISKIPGSVGSSVVIMFIDIV